MMLGTGEIVILLILLAGTILWLFALLKIAADEKGTAQKIWLVFVALTHILGAIVYLLARQFEKKTTE